jgi:alkylation response protein AidB-like acyl-CoA dehydrogenase
MDFEPDQPDPSFLRQLAAFLDEYDTEALVQRCRSTGTLHDWEFHRELARRGWFGGGWPVRYGGRGERGAAELRVLTEELERRGLPADGLGMTMLVARVLLQTGSEALKQTVLPRAIAGESLICLGYTESHGGSDVASARTTAVPDGNRWVINGHKMFTTLAHEADYVFLLTRTAPDGPKHRSLTLFLVPMGTPGIEVQPVWTIGDVRTNATYFSDVVVDDSARVGDVNGGWSVLGLALQMERTGQAPDDRLLTGAIEAARTARNPAGRPLLGDPTVRERLVRILIDREVAGLLRQRARWIEQQGSASLVEGSMYKLFSAETQVRAANDLLDLFGSEALLERSEPQAVSGGELAHEFRHSIVVPIYGGSSEVQRRIIAERGLGLPRSSSG